MNVLIVIARSNDVAKTFMQQIVEAVLLNDGDPDLLIWHCKNITDEDAAKIQDSGIAIGTHFIAL